MCSLVHRHQLNFLTVTTACSNTTRSFPGLQPYFLPCGKKNNNGMLSLKYRRLLLCGIDFFFKWLIFTLGTQDSRLKRRSVTHHLDYFQKTRANQKLWITWSHKRRLTNGQVSYTLSSNVPTRECELFYKRRRNSQVQSISSGTPEEAGAFLFCFSCFVLKTQSQKKNTKQNKILISFYFLLHTRAANSQETLGEAPTIHLLYVIHSS